MVDSVSTLVLWLFVINLGITFGAGLYESRMAVPQWLETVPGHGMRWNAAAAREADVGLRFWAWVTTGPLTLLTLASLFLAWRSQEPLRTWWLIACTTAVVERLMTFSYFIPTMVTLMRDGAMVETAAARKAHQWARLGLVRHAATLIAWLSALKALSLL
jgi:hypothetical protein